MPFLERVTKPVVIISALWVAGLLVSTPIEWPNLRWVALAAFFGSFVAARRFPTGFEQALGSPQLVPPRWYSVA